jgi:hypothetical protein
MGTMFNIGLQLFSELTAVPTRSVDLKGANWRCVWRCRKPGWTVFPAAFQPAHRATEEVRNGERWVLDSSDVNEIFLKHSYILSSVASIPGIIGVILAQQVIVRRWYLLGYKWKNIGIHLSGTTMLLECEVMHLKQHNKFSPLLFR